MLERHYWGRSMVTMWSAHTVQTIQDFGDSTSADDKDQDATHNL